MMKMNINLSVQPQGRGEFIVSCSNIKQSRYDQNLHTAQFDLQYKQ